MKFKALVLLAALLSLTACEKKEEATAKKKQPATLETEADRFSYGLGMIIGERVLKEYGDINYKLLLKGIKAQHRDQETLLSLEEAGTALSAYMEKELATRSEASKAKGVVYLQENAKKEGVQVTASGLQYRVLTATDGAMPMATDNVTVHYRGTLIDGTEFDSSYTRGEPASFGLDQVIPGWSEGVQLMNVGSKFEFVIPYYTYDKLRTAS